MKRTNVVELKPSPKQRRILQEMMLLSSCVYNIANYETRQSFFKKEKVRSFFELIAASFCASMVGYLVMKKKAEEQHKIGVVDE